MGISQTPKFKRLYYFQKKERKEIKKELNLALTRYRFFRGNEDTPTKLSNDFFTIADELAQELENIREKQLVERYELRCA